MNSVRTALRTVLVWAMLPLTAFSGSPRYVCLCSTGDFKLFCHGTSSEPSCKEMADASAVRFSNPSEHGTCCHRKAASSDRNTTCAAAECRCTPLVALPDTPPKAEPGSVPTLDLAMNDSLHDSFLAVQSAHHRAAGTNFPLPAAGRDVLTVLSRLVI